jgi:uncharacterized protein (DUF1499 family)
MTPFAWLIGLILPACAAAGVLGLPAPVFVDMEHIQRPSTPNTALAAPAGMQPAPDIVTPSYPISAPRLYDAVRAVAADQPRVFLSAEYPAEGQLQFVARSAIFNFPDLITAQVNAAGPDSSTLMLYSRSVYGYADFGANSQRMTTWLAALQSKINPTGEK